MKLHNTKIDDEIYYYFLKNGEKRWLYRHKYYDSLGKRREKKKSGFKTEKAALRSLLEVKTTLLNGEIKLVENDQITVSQWLDIWYNMSASAWKITTKRNRKSVIKNLIKPLIGSYKLNILDRPTYQKAFIDKLESKNYKTSTIRAVHVIFKTAVNAAIDEEILVRNRFNKVNIPLEESYSINGNFLTPEELNKLLTIARNTTNDTSYSLLLTLAYTGMRKGEALGLRWSDIDFNDSSVTISRTRDNNGVRTPKTKNSYRTIIIDDILLSQLKKYKLWCKKRKLMFGGRIENDDHIFLSTHGNPLTETVINRTLNRLIENHQLKKITVHGLRHTHATILMNNNLPSKVIAERLGNTPHMIDNIYGHVLKEMEDKAVMIFGESLIGAKTGAK